MIYLYIKTHNQTGLKYFGKTSKNPHKYGGSGVVWKRHIKKYGNDVNTVIYGIYTDSNLCTQDAIDFSIRNDIVSSDAWANLIQENGLDGKPVGSDGHVFTDEQRQTIGEKSSDYWSSDLNRVLQSKRLSDYWKNNDSARESLSSSMTGKKRPRHSEFMKERSKNHRNDGFMNYIMGERSQDHKDAIRDALKGKPKSESHKEKLRVKKPITVCRLHDRREMSSHGYQKWLTSLSDA